MATSQILLPILGAVRDIVYTPGMLWFAARPYLLFDSTIDELITWSLRMPDDYASGLVVKWQYSMISATTGVVALRSQVMAVSANEYIDTDIYDTEDTSADSTVPGTLGWMKEISFSLTNVDSVAAGDYFSLRLGRKNATGGTNAVGDMAVWAISLIYTTT